jgi:RimJ/RimL family protein N-acetyltransferase
MIELKTEEYSAIFHFFNEKKQHIPALSVLLGNYPGRVFADDTIAPTLAVVWTTARWMYAAGDISGDIHQMKLISFLQTVVVPDCKQRQESWFEIYTDDGEAWTNLFLQGYAGLSIQRHMESVYELRRERFIRLEAGAAAEFSPDDVTVAYEEFPVLEEQENIVHEIYNRFGGLHTVGAVVSKGDQIMSLCKNNGFIVNNSYFIDVDTYAEAERGKGYATLAARSLIRYYLERGCEPLWETTHENTASHRLALKLGFEPVESYPVFAFDILKKERYG